MLSKGAPHPMPTASHIAQHDFTHAPTHTVTSPFAVDSWRCPLLKVVPVLIGMLGLGLPGSIWAEGLALDVPTAPVHLAVASADSAAMTVDLSDPTKYPFSSTGKWTGYLEFLGKPGTERSLGQPDLFLPILQDTNDMTFFNLRGQLQFDNTDVSEYNIGLGHRHMFTDWILGGYGYYDHRNTQLGNAYRQFTGGMELMSVDWAFRVNGYLPENKTETVTGGATFNAVRAGDQLNMEIDGIVQEKALPGLDGEVGYLLPIPWDGYTAVFDETRVYAGGYHFNGEDQFESVTGPRGRVEWRAYDLPVLGPGSRFMMGVEAQWDEPRGSQAFGLASLRIPFDVFSDKSERTQLAGLDRRMLQPVIRDVDVVTSQYELPTEIAPARNLDGVVYDKVVDAYTLDELNDFLGEAEQGTRLIFFHGDPNLVVERGAADGPYHEDVHMVETNEITIPENFTLASTGFDVPFRFKSRYFQDGYSSWREEGTRAGFYGTVKMEAGTHLVGLVIDGTDYDNYPIHITGAGNRYLNHMIAHRPEVPEARGHHNLYIQNGATVYADHFISWNSGFAGIRQESDTTLYLTNGQIVNSKFLGMFVGARALLHMEDVLITGNTIGLGATGGTNPTDAAIVIANRLSIIDNRSQGIKLWGANLHLTNSVISGNGGHGIIMEALNGWAEEPPSPGGIPINDGPVYAYLENVQIYGNRGYGIKSLGATLDAFNITFEVDGEGNTAGDYTFQEGIVRNFTPRNYYCTYMGNTFTLNGVEIEPEIITTNELDPAVCALPEEERY